MKKILWFFLAALLAVDVAMLLQRRQLEGQVRAVERRTSVAVEKAGYADEEETLLTTPGVVPATFPLRRDAAAPADAVQIFLLLSVDGCSNSLVDEVRKLNPLARQGSPRITGIEGYFVDENQAGKAQELLRHLLPAPAFPIAVKNALAGWPAATPPLVLVVRTRDGRILDAHKPIPEDLSKRDAFYARWTAVLGLR
jgi:hypothetical protein